MTCAGMRAQMLEGKRKGKDAMRRDGRGRVRLLPAWLHARRWVLLYLVLFCGILFLVYGLYGLPWGTAGYACLLGVVLRGVFAGADFARFAARHHTLSKLAGRFPTGSLPEAGDMTEQDYVDIILALEAERARLAAEKDAQRRDAAEYYTLWVHQVKTPIAALRLLLQSGKPAAGRAPAMEQELMRIEQYVGMALQYQRLSSMEGDLTLRRHELATLVNRAVKGCAPLFIYQNLPLRLGEIAGSVVTDEKWFVFVLEQLLTNAVKYTKKGEVFVYTEGDVLIVRDTGRGIAPEDLPRVFERGFTGAAGRSERSSTGLGLYLCREVLDRLGFGISIQSAKGEGTHVCLQLVQWALPQD